MAYDISWVIPRLRNPGKLWTCASTITVAVVGLFSKIFVEFLNKTTVFNREALQRAMKRPSHVPLLTVSNHHSCFDDPGIWDNFYREGEHQSQGGVGFLVHKSLVNNIVQVESVSSRVAFLILRITKRYSLKVIQVYAPTSAHPDEEVEAMYEDLSRAMHASKTFYTVVMGDFNAKLGKRSGTELRVGQFGYGQRNHRGQMLADFLEKISI